MMRLDNGSARVTRRASGTARIVGGEIVCSGHGKRLGVVSERGLELWCKGEGGHAVLLPFEEICRVFLKQ